MTKFPPFSACCAAGVLFWLFMYKLQISERRERFSNHSHRLQIKVASRPPSDMTTLLMDRVLRPVFIS